MKKITGIFLFGAAALNFAACGGASTTSTNVNVNGNRVANNAAVVVNDNSNMTTNTNSMSNGNSMSNTSSSLSSDDQKFMTEAAQGGMAEVKLGELAAKNASSADVKGFGSKMVQDHSNANTELKAVAAKKGVTLPADVNAEQKAMYDKLAKLSGAEFDKEYVKGMVADHEKDVADFKKQSAGGKDADAKAFAAKTLPTLESHLSLIKGIQGKMK